MSKYFTAISIKLFLFAFAQAQVTPVVTSNKNKIYIGEPFILKFELKAIHSSAAIQWKLPDTIPHFEIIAFDTTNVLAKKITLTSFDSGLWVVDGIEVIVPSNVNNQPQLIKFPAKQIAIEYDTTGQQLLNDIKPIVEVNAGRRWIGIIVAALAFLSFTVLFLLLRKWKKKNSSVLMNESPGTALEDLLKIVQQLKKESWATQIEQKKHFSKLLFEVKRYFERKLQKPFSHYTTDAFVLALKPYLSNEELIAIKQALRLSDAVKFAKFTAMESECLQVIDIVSSIVKKYEKEFTQHA